MLLLPITTIPLGKQHVWLCVISAPHYDFKLIFHEETHTSHSCMLESVIPCLLSVKSDCLGSALLLRGITLDQCPTLLHIQISHFHRGTRKVALFHYSITFSWQGLHTIWIISFLMYFMYKKNNIKMKLSRVWVSLWNIHGSDQELPLKETRYHIRSKTGPTAAWTLCKIF